MKKESGIELELYDTPMRIPEIHLWVAVLQLAILDAEPYIRRNLSHITYDQVRHGISALNWLMSEHCRRGSFSWICYILGVDCNQIRRLIGLNNTKVW